MICNNQVKFQYARKKLKYAPEKARKYGIICTEICKKKSMKMHRKTDLFIRLHILTCKKHA